MNHSLAISLYVCLFSLITSHRATAQDDANSKPESPLTLRVLSYNIHHAEGVDGKLDLQRIAALIRSVDPDVVALQEVDLHVKRSADVDQAAELGKLTKLHYAFGDNIALQGGKYGNAVLAKSELAIVANHRLPNHEKGEQRGALELKIKHSGKEIRMLATHLDHRRDPQERLESIEILNQLAEDQPATPTLLIGDLNATYESDVLQRAIQVWQHTTSKSMPTIPVSHPERQIDFVLTFPRDAWIVKNSRVLDEATASDHRAIFIELSLK